jgi:hypothetical protein
MRAILSCAKKMALALTVGAKSMLAIKLKFLRNDRSQRERRQGQRQRLKSLSARRFQKQPGLNAILNQTLLLKNKSRIE